MTDHDTMHNIFLRKKVKKRTVADGDLRNAQLARDTCEWKKATVDFIPSNLIWFSLEYNLTANELWARHADWEIWNWWIDRIIWFSNNPSSSLIFWLLLDFYSSPCLRSDHDESTQKDEPKKLSEKLWISTWTFHFLIDGRFIIIGSSRARSRHHDPTTLIVAAFSHHQIRLIQIQHQQSANSNTREEKFRVCRTHRMVSNIALGRSAQFNNVRNLFSCIFDFLKFITDHRWDQANEQARRVVQIDRLRRNRDKTRKIN